MELALIALRQTAVMFLLMGIGWALCRGGKISRDGSRELANLLLYVILPSAILNAFCTEYTAEKSRRLLCAFGLSLAAHRPLWRGLFQRGFYGLAPDPSAAGQ